MFLDLKIINSFFSSFQKLPKYIKIIIFLSIFIGSLVRFLGLFSFGYGFDTITTQYDWGLNAYQLGYFNFWNEYPKDKLFDYPPLSLFYQMILVAIGDIFFRSKDPIYFVLFHKLVQWLLEIYFIYLLGKVWNIFNHKKNILKSLTLSLVYLIPSIWFVSAVWGQNDSTVFTIAFVGFLLLFKPQKNNNIWYKSKYFWSGVIWSIAIWFKQQPLLFLPVILLYFFNKYSWKEVKQLIIFLLPTIFLVWLMAKLYTLEEEVVYFYNIVTTNWLLMRDISLIILISGLFILFIFRNIKSKIKFFLWWSMGFMLISNIISIPLMYTNYARFGSVVFVTIGRENRISHGAHTFWTPFKSLEMGEDNFLKFDFSIPSFSFINTNLDKWDFSLGLTVDSLGKIIFILIVLGFLYKILDLNIEKLKTLNLSIIFEKKLKLSDFIWLLWLVCSSYFLFFTKIHSRYLHYGILLSWFALATIKNTIFFRKALVWMIIFNIFYFFNQLAVLGGNNQYPIFVKNFTDFISDKFLNIDLGVVDSIVLVYTFFSIYFWLINNYNKLFEKEKN